MAAKNSTRAVGGNVFMFKPRVGGKRDRSAARSRYVYPRNALEQAYFTVGGDGKKFPALLGLLMLSSDKFESQIELLLSQLTHEGFDVSGPLAEHHAMRELIKTTRAKLDELQAWVTHWQYDYTEPAREYAEKTDRE